MDDTPMGLPRKDTCMGDITLRTITCVRISTTRPNQQMIEKLKVTKLHHDTKLYFYQIVLHFQHILLSVLTILFFSLISRKHSCSFFSESAYKPLLLEILAFWIFRLDKALSWFTMLYFWLIHSITWVRPMPKNTSLFSGFRRLQYKMLYLVFG